MIEAGEQFAHVDTPGGYIEVDTQQDFDYARRTGTSTGCGHVGAERANRARLCSDRIPRDEPMYVLLGEHHEQATAVPDVGRRLAAAAAFVKDLIADDCAGSAEEYRRLMEAAVRSAVALQEMRRARRRHRRRVVAQELHRRHRRAGPRLRAQPQPGRRPPVDDRRRQALAEAARLHRPGSRVPENSSPSGRSRRRCRRRRCSASGCGTRRNRRRRIPTREIVRRDCVPILRRELELLRDAGRVDRADRRPAPVPVRRSGGPRASTTTPIAAADFAVDMDNQVVERHRRREAGRPPLPPRRRPRPRRG